MAETDTARVAKPVLLRWIARVILVLWALWWLFFNIASGIGEVPRYGVQSMYGHFVMAAVILVAALIAWFFEGVGGILLIVLSLAGGYMLVAHFARWASFTVPTMALPMLVAGALLVVQAWCLRKPRA